MNFMGYTIKYRNLEVVCDTVDELEGLINSIQQCETQKKQPSKTAAFWSEANKVSPEVLMRTHIEHSFLTKKQEDLIVLLLKGHSLFSATKLLDRSYVALRERMVFACRKHNQLRATEKAT